MKSFCILFVMLGLVLKISGAELQRVEVTAGQECGDFRGSDGPILQAAVNYVRDLGGGTGSPSE